jgi:hypothetical protein
MTNVSDHRDIMLGEATGLTPLPILRMSPSRMTIPTA